MRKHLLQYAAAALFVVIPLLINLNFGIFRESALLLFFTGVILSAMYLGTGPTMAVIIASLLLEDYFFIGATRQLHIDEHYLPRLIVFSGVSLLIGMLVKNRNAAEEKLKQLAWYDPLTGLARRELLRERFMVSAAIAERENRRLALLFLDADNFKNINDTCGHHCGDALLQQVAKRLAESIRQSDTAARQGGDEFLVLLSETGSPKDAEKTARQILNVPRLPYRLDKRDFTVTFSAGIALYPEHGRELDELIKQADSAMYAAKSSGRNTCRLALPADNPPKTVPVTKAL